MNIMVTGGCGFIGSNFLRLVSTLYPEWHLINIDKLTYAGNQKSIVDLNVENHYKDICDEGYVHFLIKEHKPEYLVHFAAESHVDNSINDPTPFLKTNILGTVNLLEGVRRYSPKTRFIHISTDEVYGSLGTYDPAFTEETRYDPRSPYSASKASSDHFVNAYLHTYGVQSMITNCSNNYGPYQHPEKFIPRAITRLLNDETIPVYGNGTNIRDWIHVEDHCLGILAVMERGKIGEKYNIGGNCQMDNITLAKLILSVLQLPENRIEFVEDRKGHDFRYDIDNTKMFDELGWTPTISFGVGLKNTVEWYKSNRKWVESCRHSE